MKQLLLLLSGLEENPGPAQANVDAEKCDIEEWEMNEVPEEDVVIQNRRTKCAVCGVGDLKLDNKVQMMVYSRSGMKRVTHQVRRCNNRNPACRALQLNFKLQHFPVRQLAGPDRSGNFPDRIDLKHNLSRSIGQTSCLLSDRP